MPMKKEERTEPKKRRRYLAAAALLIFAGVLFWSVRITDITVTGNKRYTQDQMVQMLFPDGLSRNTALCYLRDRIRPHQQIPFVEDYKIEFQSWNRVEVIVYEKSVVGCVSYMSSYLYFDKDGIIVESSSQQLEGVPRITGLKFGHIVLYQELPVERKDVFQEILNLTQILSIYEIKADRIQIGTYGDASLYMGELEVKLGSNQGLNGKIGELKDMLPQLEGRSGTLYLDDYDENDSNAMYTFKPR